MAEFVNLAPLLEEIERLKLLMAKDESDTRKHLSRLPNPRNFEEQENDYRYRSRAWSEFRNRNDVVRQQIDYLARIVAEIEMMKNPTVLYVGNIGDPRIAERLREITDEPSHD